MSLFLAEVRRFSSRRLVRGMLILVLLLLGFGMTLATVNGEDAQVTTEQNITFQCDATGNNCEPVATDFVNTTEDTHVHFDADLKDALDIGGVYMLLIALVLGASFIAAEFRGDSLTSQLLFEPRRPAMHAAKTAAAFAGGAIFSVIVSLYLTGAMFLSSSLTNSVGDIDMDWWTMRAATIGRVAIVVGIAAVFGYAVALLTRRTGAAIAVFFAQILIVFILSPESEPYGFISKYAPVRGLFVGALTVRADGLEGIHTMGGAWALMLVWLTVLVLIGGAYFSRAEVR